MKRCCAVVLFIAASAVSAQARFPSGMPDEIRPQVQERLVLRSQDFLQSTPLEDELKRSIRKVDDKTVLDAIERDAAMARFSSSLSSFKSSLNAKAKARLALLRLSKSGIPDAALASLQPGLSKTHLASLAAGTTVDMALLVKLAKMFPQHFKFDRGETVQLHNPKTPVVNDPPAIVPADPTNALPAAARLNRDTQLVWRTGFNAVSALVDTTVNPPRIVCSGVVIAKEWFLTATHCLFDLVNETPLPIENLSVFLPFQNGSETITNQERQMSTRMLRASLTKKMSWIGETTGRSFPRSLPDIEDEINRGNDVMLLELAPTTLPNPLRSLTVPLEATANPPLTLAGYGRTNVGAQVNGQLLEVGTQIDAIIAEPNKLTLAEGHGLGRARICPGDSGGPVFLGNLSGRETGAFPLIALASAVAPNPGGLADACVDGSQLFTRLDRKEVRQWLCSRANLGC